eukprot:2926071-Pyramimonas_sp.AAC.1
MGDVQLALGRSMPPRRILCMASRTCLCIHCCSPVALSALWAASRSEQPGCPAVGRGDANGDVACRAW